MAQKRADQIEIGDFVDLEGDKYADPKGENDLLTYEYIEVLDIERETTDCIRIDFDGLSVGFPPDHILNVNEYVPREEIGPRTAEN